MRRGLRFAVRGIVMAGLLLPLASRAQAQQQGACTLDGKHYHCVWSIFRHSFDTASTIGVHVAPRDPQAARQIREFAATMNKSVVPGDQAPADLNMMIAPVPNGGVIVGSNDLELATLLVYGRNDGATQGPLLWSETLTAQPDLPWPAQVHQLIEQFRSHFTGKMAPPVP